jgi:hypothetical protein
LIPDKVFTFLKFYSISKAPSADLRSLKVSVIKF